MKNIYKAIFILFPITCLITYAFPQTAPPIQWQNTIGGSSNDQIYSIHQTSDGGYILGGYSNSDSSGDKTQNNYDVTLSTSDYWIVKTDSVGSIQWQKAIGGSLNDYLNDIRQTADGGYIMGGWSNSDISGDKTENCSGSDDMWIVKTDSAGNIQWQNTIGGSGSDELWSLQQTTDGGYIFGGESNSNISGDKTENCIGLADYWIVKTDAAGNIQWQNTIGGSEGDYLYSIQQTSDGGYICGGWSESDISGDKTEDSWNNSIDYWIVKTDGAGTIQWQNTIGGNNIDALYSVQQTSDGGYILGGRSFSNLSGDKTENCSGPVDYWLVKTDATGTIQWQNTIGGNNVDALCSVRQTTDDGYILGGWSDSDISGDKTDSSKGGRDYWIIKTNSTGTIQWQKTIGGNNDDNVWSVKQTADGGYILGGFSASIISGDKTEGNWDTTFFSNDFWIVKLAPDTITGISPNPILPNGEGVAIAPNPLINKSKLTFKNTNKEKFIFTLYDITGRITESVSTTNNEIILTKGSKQTGVYLFNLMNEKTGERWNGKIMISE